MAPPEQARPQHRMAPPHSAHAEIGRQAALPKRHLRNPHHTLLMRLLRISLIWPTGLRQFQTCHRLRAIRCRLQSGRAARKPTPDHSAEPICRPWTTRLLSMPRSYTGHHVESTQNETIFRFFSLTPSPRASHSIRWEKSYLIPLMLGSFSRCTSRSDAPSAPCIDLPII